MSPARLLHSITRRLQAAGIDSAEAEAGLLLEAASGQTRFELLTQTTPLSPAVLERLEAMLQRRLAREPLQYILGVTHFYGLELAVAPGVLIPRPETEVLVGLALERLSGAPVVLDVGTGSGAIALAIAAGFPAASVFASDISADALDLAGRNAAQLALEVTFLQADLLTGAAAEVAARADLLVSNPPYLPAADSDSVSPEVQRDPALALYAGTDGLDVFRRLLQEASGLLRPGAWLLVELDPRNVRAAQELAEDWEALIETDLVGRERFLLLRKPSSPA